MDTVYRGETTKIDFIFTALETGLAAGMRLTIYDENFSSILVPKANVTAVEQKYTPAGYIEQNRGCYNVEVVIPRSDTFPDNKILGLLCDYPGCVDPRSKVARVEEPKRDRLELLS